MMSLSGLLILLLPVILAIHNAEEYGRAREFGQEFHARLPAQWVTPQVIRPAMVALIATVALLAMGAARTSRLAGSHSAWTTLWQIAVFALCFNAFGHGLLSLWRRRLVPGTISALALALALALVMPYGALVIMWLIGQGMPPGQLFAQVLLGLPAGPLATLIFLGLGQVYVRVRHPSR